MINTAKSELYEAQETIAALERDLEAAHVSLNEQAKFSAEMIASLQRENGELRKDGERFKWLLDMLGNRPVMVHALMWHDNNTSRQAIDAEMGRK